MILHFFLLSSLCFYFQLQFSSVLFNLFIRHFSASQEHERAHTQQSAVGDKEGLGLSLNTLGSQTSSFIMAPQVSGWPRRLLLLPSTLPVMILYLLCTALILRTYPTSHIFHFNTQISLSISCFFEFAAYFHECPLSSLCQGLIRGRRWLRLFFISFVLLGAASKQTSA